MTPRAVALGGGHGLQATLTALRRVTTDITAVVTVADDGGSSGRLRRELGLLPPGDLRQALAALADAEHGETLWAELFQHRFGGNGALTGHAVGNLVLAGLFEVLGDPVAALDEARRLLGVSGRVLPMSCEPLDIEAEVTGLSNDGEPRTIRGQVAVASTPGRVRRIELRTRRPDGVPAACPEAVDAVLGADVVFLGPGSWFTSVLPHLLVPGLHDALVRTEARKVVILNLIPQPGETAGFSPERHLHVLFQHAPELRVDVVIADRESVPAPARLRDAAAQLGARALLADVADPNVQGLHDPDALAACVREALGRRVADGRDGEGSREGPWR
ncbi:putative cofD-like protein [Amycolatopsis bartoniae]|uniref:Putative gluconeogenesis factor n=1 Tax=Amycolatopsis bartoniae TaxID=941986 RepID=A0A8H9INM7_9PSEU|nr:uridine diphosphate-N-acetylglucosamine-binding protein YvcK [Amycolatopsis bartoniae]MBB2939189.1 putative cofD-like protein [Amycolatopsis bartoniae]TVT09612.1 uridine diphosphate-N-acetylglucosamine-binding protein YvcK [Amycolatopsis bartoniae]GHF38346.1 putative gluconeogenesis factor [Amycolatopsis bartoniae]